MDLDTARVHKVCALESSSFFRGNNGLENTCTCNYQPIPCFLCSIEALIPWGLPSGFMLLYYKPRELVNNYYLQELNA